jgi:hypothetical protein
MFRLIEVKGLLQKALEELAQQIRTGR